MSSSLLLRNLYRGRHFVTYSTTSRCFSAAASSSAATAHDIAFPMNKHRSNAQELIAKVAVIEVDAPVASCDGGGGATGHPIEFIRLDKRQGASPTVCKYCGLRYQMKPHGHH